MGQKSSHQVGVVLNKSKLPLSWILRGQHTTHNPYPEQPIKFQYKTKRKQTNNHNKTCTSVNNIRQTINHFNKPKQSNNYNMKNTNVTVDRKCKIIKTQNAPLRTKSEPSLVAERNQEKHRRKKKFSTRIRNTWNYDDDEEEEIQQFGYEIQDVDEFLAKATIEKPANIPVVLAFPSILYQTRTGGYQAEISLPLGMVVNAVFKNQHWLYVQTPHAEEGYVSYAACLPLGIIPPPEDDKAAPCWEISTDVFPKPSGNMTDTEKLSSKSECGDGDSIRYRSRKRNAASTCGERSFDRLYLRAAASTKNRGVVRQTLLVIECDYVGSGNNSFRVRKGDVVFLIDTQVNGWFWVRNKNGLEGFIPAAVAGHGFL